MRAFADTRQWNGVSLSASDHSKSRDGYNSTDQPCLWLKMRAARRAVLLFVPANSDVRRDKDLSLKTTMGGVYLPAQSHV
jgi:hypothetical protein